MVAVNFEARVRIDGIAQSQGIAAQKIALPKMARDPDTGVRAQADPDSPTASKPWVEVAVLASKKLPS
jgi:hypothetical protein